MESDKAESRPFSSEITQRGDSYQTTRERMRYLTEESSTRSWWENVGEQLTISVYYPH